MKEDRAQQDLREGEGGPGMSPGACMSTWENWQEKPVNTTDKEPERGRKPGKALLQKQKGRELQEGRRRKPVQPNLASKVTEVTHLKVMVLLTCRGGKSYKVKAEG